MKKSLTFKAIMPAKRIILMYISEISGHRSAALAIEKAIKIISPDTEVLSINAFKYTSPVTEKIINSLYMGTIKKTPQIWRYLYDNPKVVKRLERIKEVIHRVNAPKLKNLFDHFKPDAIACTQAYPCGMVADFKKIYNYDIPLIAVLTDYIPHSYWIYDTVDYYIVPSEEVALTLMRKGVQQDKIKIFGIPFDNKFNEPIDKNKVLQKFKLKPDIFTVLIMGGGHGIGPIKTIVKSLDGIKTEIQEIVVTGANKKLYNSLKKKIKKYKKKILVLGFVNNVNELMSISDIIVTKPGGITTAEALAKHLPMIIVKPIPGQEASNTEYLIKNTAAIKIDEPRDAGKVLEDLLLNQSKLNLLRESAYRISKPNASLDIAQFILGVKSQHLNFGINLC